MNFEIKHNYRVPKSVIDNVVKNINSKKITFGVHSEDSNKHSNRDKVQQGTLHKLYYNNGKPIPPISNAELLRKTETQRTETVYRGNQVVEIKIPSRPVLLPIHGIVVGMNPSMTKRAIAKAFKFKDLQAFDRYLNKYKRLLGRRAVYDFVKNRGMGAWEGGEHNGAYTQAVKFFDKLGDSGIDALVSNDKKFIKTISNWDTAQNYSAGDTPLMDSLDLLNSIKSKVVKQ